jgi:hypothetical protein
MSEQNQAKISIRQTTFFKAEYIKESGDVKNHWCFPGI